ncbi:MAG: hypothetical protein GYA23_06855 [Methanomicrobiales archaeon]|nr:hypothetical protein [Methanomicrobiales archaeon]
MKKIVLFMLGLFFLPMAALAYQVNIEAPDTLTVGKPLVVTGETTFGIGTPIDVVLYHQLTTTTEVKRKIVYIQPDKTFKAVFDTTGLKTGTYKVEVPSGGMSGDSVTMRVIQLIDRSDAIHLTSSLVQPYSGKILVAGSIVGGENSGVQIEVVGPDNNVMFGPRYVNTNNMGDFSVEVPVTENGNYEVSFTDAKGYLGAKTFTVVGTLTFAETPVPTQAPPQAQVISAHAAASADNPVYFLVRTGTGPVTLYTSTSDDWVLEYIDANGIHKTINVHGTGVAERIELAGSRGKTIYVKMYPRKAGNTVEAFLYGQNVASIIVSPDIPAAFAALEAPAATGTPESPLHPLLALAAICGAVLVFRRVK